MSKQKNNSCTQHVSTQACNPTNNLLSYGGLVDARISASGKDLPVWLNIFLSWLETFKEYSKIF